MTTKNFSKKTMFMNIISVVIFGFGFAACSNDDCEFESNNNEFNKKADDPSQHQAYGLTYHNFDSANDVQILNNDTTEIAVKKSPNTKSISAKKINRVQVPLSPQRQQAQREGFRTQSN